MTASLIQLFQRDLDAISDELQLYNDTSVIWKTDKYISNCSGNLALHIVGNLNHFVGAILGNTGYVRQRNLEFSKKDVPIAEIITNIEVTKVMISSVLSKLTSEDLQSQYKHHPKYDSITTEYFLLHLQSHLAYHLGQINYHRRLLDVML